MDNFHTSLLASMTSVCVFAPCDTLRIQYTVQQQSKKISDIISNIMKFEGVKGFYRGLGLALMTTPLYTSLYLGINDLSQNQLAQQLGKKKRENLNLSEKIVTCMSTAAIVNTLTCPLWVIKSKIQSNTQTSNKMQIISNIYRQNGVQGYYKGLGASYLTLSNVAIYYGLYDELKENLKKESLGQQLTSADIGFTSATAKFVSMVCTYPTTMVMTCLQCSDKKSGIFNLIAGIYQKEGIAGFFRGIKVEAARSIPSNALTFMIYEKFKTQQSKQQLQKLY